MADGKNIRSKFSLQFEAPGAEQTQKKLEKIQKALAPQKLTAGLEAMAKIQTRNIRQLAAMQKQVQSLGKTFQSLEKIVDRIGRAMDKIEGGRGGGGSGGGGGRRGGGGSGGGTPQAPDKSPNALRGFLQGLGLGDFYPSQNRGGMVRQAGGHLAGRFVRGTVGAGMQAAGGLASSPFTGLSGVQTAFSSIPGGGIVSGALQQGQAMADVALQHQRGRMGLLPFLGGQGVRGFQAGAVAADRARKQEMGKPILMQGLSGGATSSGEPLLRGPGQEVNMSNVSRGTLSERDQGRYDRRVAAREARADRKAAEARAALDPLAGMNALGQGFGKTGLEMNDFLGALGQRGGKLGDLEFTRSALSAQALFGAGGDSTGAFLKASKRGGIAGAEGGANQSLVDAIKAGMSAGMDEAEIGHFLENISHRQDEFLRTGIRVSPQSLGMLTGTIAGTGLGAGRGGALADALTNRAGTISQQGPQTAGDFLMLQKMGGFRGGSLEDLESSLGKMEDLDKLKPGQFMDFVKTISSGAGGGTAGRFNLRSVFGEMGAQLGVGESKLLQSAAEGGPMSGEDQERIAAIQQQIAQRRREAAGLSSESLGQRGKAAVGAVASGVQRQAGLDNIDLVVGQKLLPTMQKFEENAKSTALALANMEPSLRFMATEASKVSKEIPKFTEALQKFLEIWERDSFRSAFGSL